MYILFVPEYQKACLYNVQVHAKYAKIDITNYNVHSVGQLVHEEEKNVVGTPLFVARAPF